MWLGKIGGLHIGIITNNGPITLKEQRKQLSLFTYVNRPTVRYYSYITLLALWWEPMPSKMALLSMAQN